ncbi:MAG: mannose-6-phosphate isomerase [Chloroflexota bacterium]|nr:mannose-6-phosphate isomerase [Chloroflexota bacterium]
MSRFGIDLHGQDAIGEAILTSGDVQVATGAMAGETLASLIARSPESLLGTRGLSLAGPNRDFPLLAKLIDAAQPLSIQVHPTDALAPAGCLGKTEAWYVLHADPGAGIMAGLVDGASRADVAAALKAGESIAAMVRSVPVVAGQVVFLPAGTIHALGAGLVIYEIQQPSFVTYRLQDWGRSRELHVAAGLEALNDSYRPVPSTPAARTSSSRPAPAVQCEQFALELIGAAPGEAIEIEPQGGPQVFTTIDGESELSTGQSAITLPTGATAVLFAHAGPARVSSLAGARVLRSWIP